MIIKVTRRNGNERKDDCKTDIRKNRNMATCHHSRAAERIDPVNPTAAMNAHISAVLCNTLERVGGVCTMVGEVRDNVEARWVGKGTERSSARWETHDIEEGEGSVALWIRHYSPRLLLPTYRSSLLSRYARNARTSHRIHAHVDSFVLKE